MIKNMKQIYGVPVEYWRGNERILRVGICKTGAVRDCLHLTEAGGSQLINFLNEI